MFWQLSSVPAPARSPAPEPGQQERARESSDATYKKSAGCQDNFGNWPLLFFLSVSLSFGCVGGGMNAPWAVGHFKKLTRC